MTLTAERPPTRQREGDPLETFSLGSDNFQGSKPTECAAQAQSPAAVAAIADLTLEASAEAAHVASVTARHFGEQMELGDLRAAEHSLRVAARHLREAIIQFDQWRALKAGACR
jgi:hypothetical protein